VPQNRGVGERKRTSRGGRLFLTGGGGSDWPAWDAKVSDVVHVELNTESLKS
jgi:hypothetical protein